MQTDGESFELEKEGKAFVIEPQDIGGFKRLSPVLISWRRFISRGSTVRKPGMEQLRAYLEAPLGGTV